MQTRNSNCQGHAGSDHASEPASGPRLDLGNLTGSPQDDDASIREAALALQDDHDQEDNRDSLPRAHDARDADSVRSGNYARSHLSTADGQSDLQQQSPAFELDGRHSRTREQEGSNARLPNRVSHQSPAAAPADFNNGMAALAQL